MTKPNVPRREQAHLTEQLQQQLRFSQILDNRPTCFLVLSVSILAQSCLVRDSVRLGAWRAHIKHFVIDVVGRLFPLLPLRDLFV